MVGQDYQEFYNDNFQAYKEGFYDNYHTDLNSASGQVNAQATGASSREKLVSVFGRLSYDYKQRYLVSAVFRYDGFVASGPRPPLGLLPLGLAGMAHRPGELHEERGVHRPAQTAFLVG